MFYGRAFEVGYLYIQLVNATHTYKKWIAP